MLIPKKLGQEELVLVDEAGNEITLSEALKHEQDFAYEESNEQISLNNMLNKTDHKNHSNDDTAGQLKNEHIQILEKASEYQGTLQYDNAIQQYKSLLKVCNEYSNLENYNSIRISIIINIVKCYLELIKQYYKLNLPLKINSSINDAESLFNSLKRSSINDSIIQYELNEHFKEWNKLHNLILLERFKLENCKIDHRSIDQLRFHLNQNNDSTDLLPLISLSIKLFEIQQYESAIDYGLRIVKINRDLGKKLLFKYFSIIGETELLVISSRKKLSTLLF